MAKKKSSIFEDNMHPGKKCQDDVKITNINNGVEIQTDSTEEIKKLSEEKSDFIDKMSEYVEEIRSLKDKIKSLEDQNTKYVLKISELNYEIEHLKSNNLKQPIQIQNSEKISKHINYPQTYRKNGYSDWN